MTGEIPEESLTDAEFRTRILSAYQKRGSAAPRNVWFRGTFTDGTRYLVENGARGLSFYLVTDLTPPNFLRASPFATQQEVDSRLGIGGAPQLQHLLQLYDVLPSGEQVSTFIQMTLAKVAQVANDQATNIALAGAGYDLNGLSHAINGLVQAANFVAKIRNTGPNATLKTLSGFFMQLVSSLTGGQITGLIGYEFSQSVIVGPTIVNWYDFKGSTINTALVVTNRYGLYLPSDTASAITNDYGLYILRGKNNQIQGNTRIGDSTKALVGLEAKTGLAVNVNSQNVNYQMLPTDYMVLGTGGVAGITVTLPAAASAGAGVGQKVVIIKSDAGVGTVTVAASGTDTIEGAANVTLLTQYKKAELISDNSSVWYDLGTGLV